jgi:uroporphyrinogen-III synthase
LKIKRILISQPEPQNDKSPFLDVATRYNLKIDFKPFIYVEGVSAKEVRAQKIDIAAHTAVIFTSTPMASTPILMSVLPFIPS